MRVLHAAVARSDRTARVRNRHDGSSGASGDQERVADAMTSSSYHVRDRRCVQDVEQRAYVRASFLSFARRDVPSPSRCSRENGPGLSCRGQRRSEDSTAAACHEQSLPYTRSRRSEFPSPSRCGSCWPGEASPPPNRTFANTLITPPRRAETPRATGPSPESSFGSGIGPPSISVLCVKVTAEAARHFLVARHALAPARSLEGGPDAVLEIFRRLGSLQSIRSP